MFQDDVALVGIRVQTYVSVKGGKVDVRRP